MCMTENSEVRAQTSYLQGGVWAEIALFSAVPLVDCERIKTVGARTVLRISKLNLFPVPVRLRCGSVNWFFVIISSYFAKFKNVVHSSETGETPSNSASHQSPNYVQRS